MQVINTHYTRKAMGRNTMFYTGFGNFQKYTTNSTTFYVGRRFLPIGAAPTMKAAFETVLSSNLIDWTTYDEKRTITDDRTLRSIND